MDKYYITFRSVTYAQKGERAFKEGGMCCCLQRAPRWMESRGCGYAIQVENPGAAAEILREKGLLWERIYRVGRENEHEEVRL